MKTAILSLLISVVLVISLSACKKKSSNIDRGCDCDTDSVYHYAYYDNFNGQPYDAWLNYVTQNGQNAWFVGVSIPNSNYSAILKVCNPDLPAIRVLTDTSKRVYGIHVKFAGRLKKICMSENQTFGFIILPETLCSYISIDSLKKQ